jgi:hypothetical protein
MRARAALLVVRLAQVAERGLPVRGRVVVGQRPFRLFGGQLAVSARGLVRLRGREVMREMTDACVLVRWHVGLDHLGDAQMQTRAPPGRQIAIQRLVYEPVTESVLARPQLDEQTRHHGGFQHLERLVGIQPRDTMQQVEIELAPDNCRDGHDRLDIFGETRHSSPNHVTDDERDVRRQSAVRMVLECVLTVEQSQQLGDEERIAVSATVQILGDVLHVIDHRGRADEIGNVVDGQRLERDSSDLGVAHKVCECGVERSRVPCRRLVKRCNDQDTGGRELNCQIPQEAK